MAREVEESTSPRGSPKVPAKAAEGSKEGKIVIKRRSKGGDDEGSSESNTPNKTGENSQNKTGTAFKDRYAIDKVVEEDDEDDDEESRNEEGASDDGRS